MVRPHAPSRGRRFDVPHFPEDPMQNRFTVKDFFYMLFAGVICLLLFLGMVKTQREVEMMETVDNTLKSQQATLASLSDAINKLRERPGLDAETLSSLLRSATPAASGPHSAVPSPSPEGSARSSAARGPGRTPAAVAASAPPNGADPYNLATPPSFEPRYDNPFPVWASNVNRMGLPQQWQVAPDAELPDDFAAGDTLVMSWNVEPGTLTPLLNNADAYSTRVWWMTFDYLVNSDLDPPFGDMPGLAKSWEVSPDGLVLTFHINENAVWQDGKPVTADDVVFTWDLAVNPKIDSTRVRSYITDNVEKWEKIDARTVRFTMKHTYFNAVGVCGNLIPIIPQHVYGDFSEEVYNKDISDLLVSNGPFKLESWEKTKQLTLVRNENYWGPKPALNKIIIRFIKNELSNLQEFWAGNLDMVYPTPDQWAGNVESERFKERNAQPILYYTPQGGYGYLGYNQRRPCFSDKRTRQALTMLVDRQGLIDTLFGGVGRETTGPFSIVGEQYDQSVKPWPYDPKRARALLAEVGWADQDGDGVLDMDLDGDGTRDPFEVTFLANSGSPLTEKIQRFVLEAFKQGGIKVNLDTLEWSVFIERLNQSAFDMVTLSWTSSPESDPYQIWHSSQAENRGSNRIAYNNPEVDRLIEAGRTTLNKPERMETWRKIHRIIHEDQPYTFLYALPKRIFLDGRFKNVVPRAYREFQQEWFVPAADQLR